MKKSRIVFFSVLVLGGCASQGRSPALGQFDAEFEPWVSSTEAVKAVTFKFQGAAPVEEALALCIAESVTNRSVSLQDSSGSFFGAYTGNYYRVDAQREAGGGSVIAQASKDGRSVVAEGVTDYSTSSLVPIRRAIRFTLSAKVREAERVFYFSRLEQAQLDTGAASNTGYGKIGVWSGADPDLALSSLRNVAESINSCLLR